MVKDNIQDIDQFSNQVKNIEFYLSSRWASTYTNYRLNIRRQLYKKTKEKSVLDLNLRPKLTDKHVSISHCPVLGGFVLACSSVGLDLEQYKRLSPSLIARVSSEDEIKLMPEGFAPAIWTIKESVYKCEQSFESNIATVKILAADLINKNFLKTACSFKNQKFTTFTLISVDQDLSISLSFFLEDC